MPRSFLMYACLIIGTFVLAACSTEQGKAISGDVASVMPSLNSESADTSEGRVALVLADVDPCALLSEAQLVAFGKNIEKEAVGELSCHWSSEGVSPRSSTYIVIQIDLRPTQAVDELKVLNSGRFPGSWGIE